MSLATDLSKILDEYAKEITEITEETLEENAQDMVDILKKTTPRDTGATANSWTYKKEGTGYRVYAQVYQAVHLLEYGTSNMSPQPFVRPALYTITEQLLNEMKKNLK